MDALAYQQAGKASTTTAHGEPLSQQIPQARRRLSQQTRLDVTRLLDRLCSRGAKREDALVLILGPAASGKTTLLKTLIISIVNRYDYFVPILVPIIEVVPVINKCDQGNGASVVVAFLQHKYPHHAHLLLQMVFMRRAVFLIDGIDESGSTREAVQDFVTVELLERGHRTIITSRHSGFSSDAFKQCQLVELLPLSVEQQSQMVRSRVHDDKQAEQLVQELGSDTFEEIASNPLMLTMMISIYLNNNCKIISNRSELYEQALRTIVSRTDKGRAGVDHDAQGDLFEHLQKLASGSHERDGERRIFTTAKATKWVGSDGWRSIETAMQAGKLPIIVSMGPNSKDEEEYRFGHMTYQEYLAAREYYQRLASSQFSTEVVLQLFGDPPSSVFLDVKQHHMLQLLAGVLSPEQLATCSAAISGGNALKVAGELGRGGAQAMVPFVKAHQTLQILDVGGTALRVDGMRLLTGALQASTTITSLNLANNDLKAEGAKIVADAVKVSDCV
jgi:predicted NACHT family NTPase